LASKKGQENCRFTESLRPCDTINEKHHKDGKMDFLPCTAVSIEIKNDETEQYIGVNLAPSLQDDTFKGEFAALLHEFNQKGTQTYKVHFAKRIEGDTDLPIVNSIGQLREILQSY